MHVSIMNLAIPCDWEILLNRFYDLPSGELPIKPEYFDEGVEYSFALFYAKCALHQITVDWTTLPIVSSFARLGTGEYVAMLTVAVLHLLMFYAAREIIYYVRTKEKR